MTQITVSGESFEVDAQLIADGFGIEPAMVQALMRAGTITSRCEKGVDEDAGRWRLIFIYQGRALRLTIDAAGNVLGRAHFDRPGRALTAGTK